MVLFCKITERTKFSELIIIKGGNFLVFFKFTFYVLLRFQLQTSKFLALFSVLDFTPLCVFFFHSRFLPAPCPLRTPQSVSGSR
jgi:hypothetical protein